jgi:hypothetical protein
MTLRIGQTLGPLTVGLGYTFGGLMGAYFLCSFVALIGLIILFTLLKGSSLDQRIG